MKDLKSFLSKKLGAPEKKPDEMKQKAKSNVLNEFKDAAKEHMADGMGDSLKKVTVMAKSQKDLEKGLELAKKISHNKELPKGEEQPSKLADMLMGSDEPEMHEMEDDESPEEDTSEEMSDTEKDSRITALEAEISKMKEMLSRK